MHHNKPSNFKPITPRTTRRVDLSLADFDITKSMKKPVNKSICGQSLNMTLLMKPNRQDTDLDELGGRERLSKSATSFKSQASTGMLQPRT